MNTTTTHVFRPPPTTPPPPPTPTQLHPPNAAAVNSNPTPNFSNADPPHQTSAASSKDDRKRRPKITAPCTECGRTFWSWKALFGHMRCHPDRLWRGIQPPPNVVVTAATMSSEYHSMSEDDHIAASSLLILAAGPHQLDDRENYRRLGCSSSSTSCKKAACLAVAQHKKIDKNSYVKQGSSSSSTDMVIKEFSTRHYECNVCSKVFSSGQALGGHKRWHWERAEHAAAASVVTTTTQVAGLMSSDGSSIGNVDLNLPAVVSEDDSSLGMDLDLRLGL